MALPNSIDSSTPPGSQSPALGDDRIREFKLAVEDIFGVPDATNVTQAAFDIDAGGLAQCLFYDVTSAPASGELGRNGSTLYWRLADSRTNTTLRPFGIIADTTGTPAASIGVGMLFQAESGDEAPSDFGALDFVASDVTAGSEDTYASIMLRVAGGSLDEKYRFSSTAGSGFAALFTHANTADRTYTLPDASIKLVGFETWSAPVRAKDTIYQNTTGATIYVAAVVRIDETGTGRADLQVDTTSPPTTVRASGGHTAAVGASGQVTYQVSGFVPDQSYYRLATQTGSYDLGAWNEI